MGWGGELLILRVGCGSVVSSATGRWLAAWGSEARLWHRHNAVCAPNPCCVCSLACTCRLKYKDALRAGGLKP